MINRVKELRARHNLTQEDLGKKVNVTRHAISAIEKEKYDPSLKLAFKLGEFFQTPLEKIFFLTENKKKIYDTSIMQKSSLE